MRSAALRTQLTNAMFLLRACTSDRSLRVGKTKLVLHSPRQGLAPQQTLLVALVDAFREPFRGELACDLRTLEADLRHDRARQWCRPALVAKTEDALVELGVGEVARIAALQIPANRGVVEVESLGELANRELGFARLVRGAAVEQQVAVE